MEHVCQRCYCLLFLSVSVSFHPFLDMEALYPVFLYVTHLPDFTVTWMESGPPFHTEECTAKGIDTGVCVCCSTSAPTPVWSNLRSRPVNTDTSCRCLVHRADYCIAVMCCWRKNVALNWIQIQNGIWRYRVLFCVFWSVRGLQMQMSWSYNQSM